MVGISKLIFDQNIAFWFMAAFCQDGQWNLVMQIQPLRKTISPICYLPITLR